MFFRRYNQKRLALAALLVSLILLILYLIQKIPTQAVIDLPIQEEVFSEIEDYLLASQRELSTHPAKDTKAKAPTLLLRPEFDLNKFDNVLQCRSEKKITTTKNCLAIIIDDVAYTSQVQKILKLGIPINISFFPPNWRHPNTPQLAKKVRHYMIHLPLEAQHYSKAEPNTIKTSSTNEEIEKIIRKIRRDFPRAIYVNNHTGSKFTADYEAMKRLLKILYRYNFEFVDSRTTAQTKVKAALASFKKPYIHRDIFLDNEQNIPYIKAQLQKAVALAKKKGFAIAIGHPHPATLKAIAQSQGILKEVRLIYLDELRFRSR